ncbi:E3 ubiquitin-protein ligase RHF2A-like [Papaver somniferum]|uniref:E3 ubiquitin-protein ligase RHF2A-like n=1 Tax=Papaver somniferum TaxID=3469 RepID=UPI000E6FA3B8|nr:E3 ubiquitin-protein ligase RHF2A-like [Papaver somniferum]XP_026425258.1 E3 ubiquitin-protein ligase RHF2A-like [Papaver somniferum]
MEGSAMDETKLSESHLVSAAAFVEGGIQEACDDACSICLEDFCDNDPSTVTGCKHEFHLQCILEWCQRSSQCPMCWQSISLKDPTSQELLEAVEHERNIRSNRPRNATIFHHPALGDFELQHLPVGANDAELEERIIQHLAAAAAMGRAHHMSRRDGHRNRSTGQGRPQFLVFSSQPNAASSTPITATPAQGIGDDEPAHPVAAASPTSPLMAVGIETSSGTPQFLAPQADQSPTSASGSGHSAANQRRFSFNSPINSAGQSSPIDQDRAGPSELQSFSETLKSKFNAVSTRYKESITKSTKGWKERLFSRNTAMADLGTEVRREVNAGIASVSRLMERLETSGRNSDASVSDNLEEGSVSEPGNQMIAENHGTSPLNDNNPSASCATSSGQH